MKTVPAGLLVPHRKAPANAGQGKLADQREIANEALRKGCPSAWRFSSRIAALALGWLPL